MDEKIEEKIDEISKGKLGKEGPKTEPGESLFEQTKRMKAETEEIFNRIQEERKKIEFFANEIAVGGRSIAGGTVMEKTQQEKDQEQADRIIKALRG